MGKEKTLEQKYENSSSISAIYPSFYLIQKDYKLDEKKCIDLGASNGRYLKLMGKGSCGVEYSNIDIEYCKKNGLNVIKGNLNKDFNFFIDQNFDFIFTSHVIEHLESPYLFLKRIHNFGGKDAKLILGYPIEHTIIGLFDPYFSHDGHLYAFSHANIKKLLNETGFKIEKIYYNIPLAGRFKLFNWIQRIVQPLPYRMVSRRSNALYIVAQKKI